MVRTASPSAKTQRRSTRLLAQTPAKKVSGTPPGKSISAARKKKAAAISSSRYDRGQDSVPKSLKNTEHATGTDRQRSSQMYDKGIQDREKVLDRREKELNSLSETLELRMQSLEEREAEASALLSQMALKGQESALKQLEEHFSCSLCYEVLASPYSLNPARCGHTFCGLCILRWFFSRLHRHCGTWHESVDCPMCRSLLIITPERTPRLQLTFPFVPNRAAASVIESLVAKLVEQPQSSSSKVAKEDGGDTCKSSTSKRCRPNRRKEKITNDGSSDGASEDSGLSAWRENGRLRQEWLKKDREGREEMETLLTNWSTMRPQDFIAMKVKLGV